HMALARSLAKRYRGRGESLEDLEQVALLALVKAASRFDPDRGVPFPAFAVPSILGEIKRYFRDLAWTMRVARPVKDLYLQARELRDTLVAETGQMPTVDELASALRCSSDELLEAMEAGHNLRVTSLEGLGVAAEKTLPSVDGEFEKSIEKLRLAELIPMLRPEDRRLIEMRFFQERTQSDIADEIGVSQMQVSRMLKKILLELRRGMAAS
ncbi:MAG: sigma-70 family RNA polymerase sigma factor, partial [Acidimicrobiales bacterium]